jgi:uncharacterized membrane protein
VIRWRALLLAAPLVAAALLLFPPGPAPAPAAGAERSFHFSRVDIDATVRADGSLAIVEARTYQFQGAFTWASYRLAFGGYSRLSNLTVADERGPYRLVRTTGGPRPAPGTYEVGQDGDAFLVRWGYAAQNQQKTFTISYVLDDVVTAYSDVAELYWKFVGTGWKERTDAVRVAVRLPGTAPASDIRVWAHGPLHGRLMRQDGGAVLEVANLPGSTMVEGRIVFPLRVVPQARNRKVEPGLPRILNEEEAWAARANRDRLLRRLLVGAVAGVPLLAIAGWLLLYLNYGREPVPASSEEYYRELPAPYTPAELGVLWRFGSVQPADFVATIVDLTRRGYIRVSGGGDDDDRTDDFTLTRTEKRDGMAALEQKALDMIFGPGAPEGATLAVGRRKGLPVSVQRQIGRGFAGWKTAASTAARRLGFFDSTSQLMSGLVLALGVLVLVGGWFVTVGVYAPAGIAMLVAGVVLLVGAGAVKRRSQRGADDLQRWKAFRKFLSDFSEMPRAELPALALWEHYLVYAIPLGVADKVIQQLRQLYPVEEIARTPGLNTWVGSSSFDSGRGGGGALGALGSFTAAMAAATSSSSSGSGGGGGFSGGGGGGGGGSGGSAG